MNEDRIIFSTKSGILSVNHSNGWIHMNFPLEAAYECSPPVELFEGLGMSDCLFVGKNRFDYIVEVADQTIVEKLEPNFEILKLLNTRGVIVTSQSIKPQYDFVSRCFFPSLGVNEDPVTGSAHCLLGPYWMNRLKKNRLKAVQVSSRTGELMLEILESRIILSGQAVTTMKGNLRF